VGEEGVRRRRCDEMNLRDITGPTCPASPLVYVVTLEELSTATDCHLGVGVGTVCNTGSALPPMRCS
jgi:hypothetical protein